MFGAIIACGDVKMVQFQVKKTKEELTVVKVYGRDQVVEKKEKRAWRFK
jgi:hypothetical protein